jgi:hypothetical protein
LRNRQRLIDHAFYIITLIHMHQYWNFYISIKSVLIAIEITAASSKPLIHPETKFSWRESQANPEVDLRQGFFFILPFICLRNLKAYNFTFRLFTWVISCNRSGLLVKFNRTNKFLLLYSVHQRTFGASNRRYHLRSKVKMLGVAEYSHFYKNKTNSYFKTYLKQRRYYAGLKGNWNTGMWWAVYFPYNDISIITNVVLQVIPRWKIIYRIQLTKQKQIWKMWWLYSRTG